MTKQTKRAALSNGATAGKNVKARAPITIGATAIETDGQRAGLARHINAIVSGENFRSGIARVQNAQVQEQRAKLRDLQFEAYDELQTLTKDGRMPANQKELERVITLRERFGAGVRAQFGVPSGADVHIDKALTNVLIDETAGEFIADLVLPLVPVDKRTDVIRSLDRRVYTQPAWDVTRGEGEPAKTGSWNYGSNVSYSIVNRALGFPIPDESQTNADAPLDPARDAMRICEEIVRLKREIAVKDLVTTASTYPATTHRLTTSTKWDAADATNVEPRNDVQTLINNIRKATGKFPNRILMNFPTAQAVCRLDDYRDRFKYVKEITDAVLMGELAAYFNVEQALIGMAMYDSAAPGTSAASYADVWPDDVVVFRQEPPSLAFTGLGFSPCTDPGTIMRWRDPDPSARTDKGAFELDCIEKIVDNNAGGHIDDVLT